MNAQPKHFVLAMTGASGAAYGLGTLKALLSAGHRVDFIVSSAGREVIAHEMGFEYRPETAHDDLKKALHPIALDRLFAYPDNDFFTPPASGSARWEAMIVCPCSMGSIGRFAGGVGRGLIERAVEVALKERRPLILVPRETPMSLIGLENLTRLARAGVHIVPASPGFYAQPENIQDLIDFMTARVLSLLGVESSILPEWGADPE